MGPTYEDPELQAPDAWHEAATAGLAAGDAALETWWTLLEDPGLNQLIQRAAEQNLDLAGALARIDEARGLRGIAVGEWFPAVQADTSAAWNRSSGEVAPLTDAMTSEFFSSGGTATWEIDLFGRIRRSVEAADADLQAAIEDYRDTSVVLYADLGTQYVEARSLQRRLEFARANVRSQLETLEIVQVRNQVGLVGDLDLRQAELNVARTRAFIPQLETARVAAWNRIAVLLGTYPAEARREFDGPGDIPEAPADLFVGLPTELLRQRPDLRRAERLLASETARIGVAKADLFPRLSLLGSVGFDTDSVASWFTGNAFAYGVGPQLTWNAFQGGRILSNVRAQEARTEQAFVAYRQALLLAVEDAENALTALSRERARLVDLEASAQAALESVELVKVLYKTGIVDFQNVLDSERSLFEQQDALAQSQGLVTQNAIQLYRALGGGWTP
ncbi:MAG: efflux transporter outer membrane subunit [Myxococcota bacterium]|nr:efflux transporter outer membrane subunit [Myxococcota bacterium]